jgi:hypothetical protein
VGDIAGLVPPETRAWPKVWWRTWWTTRRAITGAHGATLTANARAGGGLDIEVSFP